MYKSVVERLSGRAKDSEGGRMSRMIFKILRPEEWVAFQASGRFEGSPVDLQDGYIHFSTASQTKETLAKHFADAPHVTILAVREEDVGADLRWEPSRGGALFPHLYRPLGLDEVAASREAEREAILATGDGPYSIEG